jgi:BirA family transcriptional regulator, biotin operon repressor / biotin---[acetyl-CoA-carboxylase] ligase
VAYKLGANIREELLTLFCNCEEDFISGQALSEKLNCTRTAIWKHIEELRKEGYSIEAVQKKGYRLISRPDRFTEDTIKYGLTTKYLGQNLIAYDKVTSTQKLAYQFAQEGVNDGTIVIAEEQTLGKGRLDRAWHSPAGTGIWMSMIIRPKLLPHQAPQLTLLTAVAIVRAIENHLNIDCEIKWPNDILIGGKKAVGILTELHADPDRINSVIIGIGINVNTKENDFPDELKQIATSLTIAKGEEVNRVSLVQAILVSFENLYENYLTHGFEMIKLLWESYSTSIGKEIVARTLHGSIKGYAKGITSEGVLMLEESDGKMHYIHSADIEL